MTWNFDTDCRYHTQDTSYYCGAATAMMVLAEIGVPYTSLDQDDLYTSNHNHNIKAGWATDPYGLRYTLIDRKPASFTNTFLVYKPEAEDEGTRKIVYTLWRYGVSPVVLVYGCMHWIVVRGVQTDVEPTSGASYAVEGLWINNPVFLDNEPHSASDACGSGGVNGVENQWVSYATWQSTYFTGCNYDSATGSDQFISVCDPDEPKIELPKRIAMERPFDGRKIIDPETAIQMVYEGMEQNHLTKDEQIAERLRRLKFEEPMLVKRLDLPDSYYYLSPAIADGEVYGYGQVDGRYGELQSVYLMDGKAKPYEMNRKVVVKRLMTRTFELPKEMGRFHLRPDTFCLAPTLVWRPCRESYSPHLPFWQLNTGNQTLYIRADGEVFTHLTTTGTGV